jgi:hypothetical protein
VAHHDVIDATGVGAGALHGTHNGDCAEVLCGDGCQPATRLAVTALAAQPLAERGPRTTYYDDVFACHA